MTSKGGNPPAICATVGATNKTLHYLQGAIPFCLENQFLSMFPYIEVRAMKFCNEIHKYFAGITYTLSAITLRTS